MSKKAFEQIKSFARPYSEALEYFTNEIIPYLIILLAVVLILGFIVDLEHYEPWVTYFDYVVVFFFAADLVFKWFKVPYLKKFVKLYWLDILVVFPFYLIARVYIRIVAVIEAGKEISEMQKFAHEAVFIKETELLKEEKIAKEAKLLSESKPVLRIARVIQRFIRLLKGRIALAYAKLIHHAIKKEVERGKKQKMAGNKNDLRAIKNQIGYKRFHKNFPKPLNTKIAKNKNQ